MMSALYVDIVKFVANNIKCSICYDVFTKPVTLSCGHTYCQKCINDHLRSAKKDCPHCRKDIINSTLDINFTLCAILELQDLGGREKWEHILAETEVYKPQHTGTTIAKVDNLMKRLDWLKAEMKMTEDKISTELISNQACKDGSGSYDTLMEVSSSSMGSIAASCNADKLHHQEQPSHLEEEISPEHTEEDADNSDSLVETAYSPSARAERCNRDNAEAALHAEFVELSFSPELGNRHLIFHPENRTVCTQQGQQVRTLNDRFDACQWMAKEEFTGGQFYWDVDTTDSTGWAVGVAYPDLKRKERLGRTCSSWCLERSSGQLSAWHNNIKTSVKHGIPSKIRVMVDMAKGQLCFQSVCEGLFKLHSFQVDFTAPLRPVFWLYGLSKNALSFPSLCGLS